MKNRTFKNAVHETATGTNATDGGADVNILSPKAQKIIRNRTRQEFIQKVGGEFLFDVLAMAANQALCPFETNFDGRFIFADLDRYVEDGNLNIFWNRHLDDIFEFIDVDVDGHAANYIRKILVPLLSEKQSLEFFINERTSAKHASDKRKSGNGRKFASYRGIGVTSLWQKYVNWKIYQDKSNPKHEENAGVQASNITQVSQAIQRELKPLYIPSSNACN